MPVKPHILIACFGTPPAPQVLSALGGLETLDLEDNDLSAFLPGWQLGPGGLGHLSRLQCLNLAQCAHLPVWCLFYPRSQGF